jgi:hypothetical protein
MKNDARLDMRLPADLLGAITTLAANVNAEAGVVLTAADLVRLALRRVTDNPALLFRPPAMEHA